MTFDENRHLAALLSRVFEGAMSRVDLSEIAAELREAQIALEQLGQDLPIPEEARLRSRILQELNKGEVGSAGQERLALWLMNLLRLVSERSQFRDELR